MRHFHSKLLGALCCAGLAAGSAMALPGADVIVGDLTGPENHTPGTGDTGYDSIAVGTDSCNIGTVDLNWHTASNSIYSWDNRHPVISQNLFRLHNGRFEQIGQAWLKHGFTALTQNLCGTCNGNGGEVLGVGCSDPYSANLNGTQSGLGPKWQVNAATGIFRYPFTNSPDTPTTTFKRLRFRVADVDPATYSGALYFAEGHYVAGDDAAAGNDDNNASYRRVTMTQASPTNYTAAYSGATVRQLPAIYAWQAAEPTVTIVTVDVPNDGRFIVACKVTNLGGSPAQYQYEYAVHNLNSNRSAGSFSVPFPSGDVISAVGFHDVEYHSGEPNQGNPATDDWSSSIGANAVTWAGPAYSGSPATYTFHPTVPYMLDAVANVPLWNAGTGNDHSANVLRWGTLFNFRFVSQSAPATGAVQIGLWRPGTGAAAFAAVPTPGGATGGAPTTGACCTGGGCSIQTAAACTGTFGGLGTTCDPDPCTTGACCFSDGSCQIATIVSCTGGTYQGNGSSCTPNNCPAPTGACCVGTTCSTQTQAQCSSNGGTYVGNGVACSPTTCASNDFCGGAQPLCDGVPVSGNNALAGNEGGASCDSSFNGSGHDVWFSYQPSGTSGTVTVTISTDNAQIPGGTTAFDTVLTVFSGCGGTELACDDDSGTSPGNSSRITNFTMTRGQTYIIRLAAYGTFAGGNYTIRVSGGGGTGCNPPTGACCRGGVCSVETQASCSNGTWTSGGSCAVNMCAPSNDNCSGRIGVGLGTTNFNNTYATTDGPAHSPACLFSSLSQIERDLWWNFPSTLTGQVIVDTCGSSFDTKVAVYDDTGCTNYDARLLACNDDAPGAPPAGCGTDSLQSRVVFNVVPNRSYTIRVGSYGLTAAGAGVMNITAVPIVTGACCITTNNCSVLSAADCTTAGGTYKGDNSPCAGDTANPITCCPANFDLLNGVDVVDLFAFLDAWFAQNGSTGAGFSSDFDKNDAVDVTDLFGYLDAWFAGCSG